MKALKRKKSQPRRIWRFAASCAGSVFLYLILGLVLMFLFERQPSSFIYVSF